MARRAQKLRAFKRARGRGLDYARPTPPSPPAPFSADLQVPEGPPRELGVWEGWVARARVYGNF